MQKDRFARRKRKLTDKAEANDDLGVATAGVAAAGVALATAGVTTVGVATAG